MVRDEGCRESETEGGERGRMKRDRESGDKERVEREKIGECKETRKVGEGWKNRINRQ